jgi:RHS repeat-associated protein
LPCQESTVLQQVFKRSRVLLFVVQNVAYHPFGGVTGYTLGNGQIYSRSVDQDGRIASYTLGGANYSIAFDLASRITGITEVGNPGNANTYGYDALDRLTSAVLPSANFGYSYDAVGNRLTKTTGAATDTYAYSPGSNRIASLTPASGPARSFVFDANGSTTSDGPNSYAYDTRGRMVQAVSAVGTTSYQVNALGQRVRKGNAATDIVFHYDMRGRLIAESDALGNVQREYLYLGDIPVMVVRQGSAAGGSEVVVDNGGAGFAVTGTWPASTAVAGYLGANYQSHEANGVPPGAIAVDNSDPGFSVTGTWTASTSVAGYLGSNYQHHFANAEPPTALVADNSSGAFTGTWPTSTSVGGYYATNYQVHTAGTGSNVFTWTLNVPSAGTYEAYARWTQHPNRATNAKYAVNHAGGASVVTVNQEAGGGAWQLLGTYSFNAGATSISLSDDANDYVIADAVMLVPPGASPNTATWTASIPAAGSYEVYARWTAHPNRATDAKYTVNHAGGASTITVNQEATSGAWNLLGTYSFNAGAATVSLTDQANGYVIADAVMFLPPGSGPNTASWTPNVPVAGQYEVFARWTASGNRATNAPYAITHAGGTAQVAVNQQANGAAWNSLGTFTFSPGTAHKVTLSDQANGYVIADAIRLVPISIPTGPEYFAMHADHLNTPRLVADAAGTTVWRWDQAEPFGSNPADEDPDANSVAFDLPLRLPGQRYDAETGLHYNYFRDYDPSLGIYKQSDLVGLRAGLNTYAYVNGNPILHADPFGLASGGTASYLGGLIGKLMGGLGIQNQLSLPEPAGQNAAAKLCKKFQGQKPVNLFDQCTVECVALQGDTPLVSGWFEKCLDSCQKTFPTCNKPAPGACLYQQNS